MKSKFSTYYFLIFILFSFQKNWSQQGASSCAELQSNFQAYQSCATSIPFDNSVGGNAETYNTSCIGAPFRGPTWFFMQIQNSGNIILEISQVNNAGVGTDVDFVLWGPFANLNNICSQLNPSTEVDCSWSNASVETVTLPNGISGEFYILLVDNYSNQPGQITITQTAGTGSSDCSFLSSVKITDLAGTDITEASECKPNTISVRANIDITSFTGSPVNLRFNYKWFKDGILISSLLDSTLSTNILPNISQSGVYKVETSAYDSTDPTVDLNNLIISSDEVTLSFHTTPILTIQTSTTECLSDIPILQGVISNSSLMTPSVDGLTYQWLKNGIAIPGATNINFTPNSIGNYTLQVSNTPCSIVLSNSILIKEKPLVAILENRTLCENENFTLTSSISNAANLSLITYQWFQNNVLIPGAISSSLSVSTLIQNVNTTATYYVKTTEQGSCENNSNIVTIRINKQPIVNLTPITLQQCDYIAPNNDGIAVVNLTELYNEITIGVPYLTLYYYSDIAVTQPILNPQTFTNTIPFNQTIYVKAIDETVVPNCTSIGTATIQLTVNPTSLSTYPNMASVCPEINQSYGFVNFSQQEAIIRTAFFPGNPVDISFFLNAIDASTELNVLTNSTQIPIGVHTIYTRIETNNNCDGIGTFQVEVKPTPFINTINQVNLCENEPFILNQIDTDALFGLSSTVQSSYFLTFQNAQNNTNALNKNNAQTYVFGSRTIYIRLFDTTTQCISINSFVIRVFKNPTINNPLPISICGDVSATFDLTIRNSVIKNGNLNYQVFFYETAADLASNTFILIPSNYNSSSRIINIKVVDPTNNNCFTTSTLTLNVYQIPGNTINPTPIELCDDSGFAIFDLTSRSQEIAGNFNLNDISIKYYKNVNNAIANNNVTINNPIAYTNSTINYEKIYVRITSLQDFDSETGLACYKILELDLYVRPYPQNNLQDYPYYICITPSGEVLREATVYTYLNSTDYSFQWYEGFDALIGNEIAGETNDFFTTSQSGLYSVLITNITNAALCSSVFNFSVQNTLIPGTLTSNPQNVIGFGVDNTITAVVITNSIDFEYSIVPDYWQESPVFNNIPAGNYVLQVRNKYGCGFTSTTFSVLDYPSFFTPNGDGINDTWQLKGSALVEVTEIYIFDRYGKLLKQIFFGGEGWDGTYNGQSLPADDYWFKITYRNNGILKEFKSNFSLKR